MMNRGKKKNKLKGKIQTYIFISSIKIQKDVERRKEWGLYSPVYSAYQLEPTFCDFMI